MQTPLFDETCTKGLLMLSKRLACKAKPWEYKARAVYESYLDVREAQSNDSQKKVVIALVLLFST
jgi:hypothetical protein